MARQEPRSAQRCLALLSILAIGLFLGSSARAGAATPGRKSFPLHDAKDLVTPALVKAEGVVYRGRKAVRITMDGIDHEGMAVLPGTDIQDGVIEVDLAWRKTTPPGVRFPGFIGIAFRVNPDARHYELFYLRPGNVRAQDQAMRNHVVQYTSEPDHGWYRLRRDWPMVYEAHAEMESERWNKVKIEVAGRTAKLYLSGATNPSLIVNGLKGQDLRGAIGLWGYTDQESYFSNLRITPAVQTARNGSDVAGSWDVRYGSDAGVMEGSMNLTREGSKVTGTWSGSMGDNCQVTGTWRDGYVELSFQGEWSKESRQGVPGLVTAVMAGWVDDAAAEGRMRVDGHADGGWIARRKG